MSEETPRIIIDEDWKERVQREKEQASRQGEPVTGEETEQRSAGKKEEGPERNLFLTVVYTLARDAFLALGALVPRDAKEVVVDLEAGRTIIDSLLVLREKTKGNLTPEEQGGLAEVIAELQRLYVARAQQAHEATMRTAGAGSGKPNP